MVIALVTTWARKCGLSVYAEHLVEGWLRMGHCVWVLDEIQDIEADRSDAPPVNRVACWSRPDPSTEILNEIAYIEPDVCVFSHDWEGLDAGVLINLSDGCHELGCALVVGWHNLVSYRHAAQELKEIDGHVVYHPDARQHLADLGIAVSRVLYVPHGCGQSSAKRRPQNEERCRIATFGLMYPSKGLEDVVSALHAVRTQLPDRQITLDVYSSYNAWTERTYKTYLEQVCRQISSLGLHDAVNIWGGFPSEAGLLRALDTADIIVLLYHQVPHRLSNSAALPFALAAGRPVVVRNIPHFAGPAERNTAHLAVDTVAEATTTIVGLLTNEAAWSTLACASSEYAEKHTYDVVAREYIQFFEQFDFIPRPRLSLFIRGLVYGERPAFARGYPLLAGPEHVIEQIPPGVDYLLSLEAGDSLLRGWDLAIRSALVSKPGSLIVIGANGGQRLCRSITGCDAAPIVLTTALLIDSSSPYIELCDSDDLACNQSLNGTLGDQLDLAIGTAWAMQTARIMEELS